MTASQRHSVTWMICTERCHLHQTRQLDENQMWFQTFSTCLAVLRSRSRSSPEHKMTHSSHKTRCRQTTDNDIFFKIIFFKLPRHTILAWYIRQDRVCVSPCYLLSKRSQHRTLVVWRWSWWKSYYYKDHKWVQEFVGDAAEASAGMHMPSVTLLWRPAHSGWLQGVVMGIGL